MKKISIVVLAVLCASAGARAAVPQLIDYQGYLMESGVAVNGTKSVTFRLFDAASGGLQLCSTGAQTVTVMKGVFSHSIGSAGCDLSTINWDNPVYLEMMVEGTTLAPRERIAGAAYSVQTKAANVIFAPSGNVSATNAQSAIEELDADKLDKTGGTISGSLSLTGDVTASGTVTATDFVGDGSALTNISAGTHNHDAVYVDAGGDTMSGALMMNNAALNMSGANGDIMFDNAGGSITLAGGGITDSAGNINLKKSVRIDADADVSGVLFIDSGLANGYYSAIDFYDRGIGKWGMGKNIDNDFYVQELGTGDRLTIKNTTGYVGIGTTGPSTALQVVGTVTATAFSGDGSALTNISAGTHNHDASYVNSGGDTMTGQLTSSVADGTAPFVVASTTKVTNLNADALDGLDSTAFMAATVDNWVDAAGDAMTGALNMGGNDISDAGTVTATDFVGDGSALTNISAGTHNHDSNYVGVGGDTMTGQLTSTVATGTAPFVVASTTKVTNLNADALDGLDSSDFMSATADNWVNAAGDAMTGALTMNNAALNMSGANGDIVFDNAGGSITLAGGGITDSAGNINLKKSVRIDADADVSGVIFIDSGLANGYYSAIDFYDRGIGKWGMGKNIDNDFYVQELGTGDRLTIKKDSGYVGIGTTGPSSALQVAGTVTATAFAGDGSALTNIAAGTHNHDASYVNVGGDTMTGQLTSTVTTGTAPFVVASATKVTNLNVDALDGLDSSDFMSATADNWVDIGGDTMTGALNMGTNDITNAGTVTATDFVGDGSALTNISAGTHNHDAAYVNVGGDTMTGALTSTVATGTAPFVVASTTKVTNLNADALDGLDSTGFMSATADNWVDAGGDAMTGALTMNNVVINMSGANADITFDNAGGALTLAGGAITDSAGSVNINDDVDINGVIQSSLPINNVVFQHAAPGRMALNATDSTESVISWSPSGLNLGWNVWEDGLSWQNGNGAAPSADLRINKGTVGTDRAFEFIAALSGTPQFYSKLAITYAGKVGLGTSAPSYNLHVKTGDESSVIAVDSGSGSAQISELTFSDRGTAKWSILKDTANGFDITEESVAMGRLHISPGGNVGIGTTSPANKLDVEGSMAVGATYSGTSAAPADGLIVEGSVGIGTNSPADKLHVDNSDASGNGAYFTTSNPGNNTGQTVYALNAGGGSSRAGRFENNNAANTACSLWANNTGGGEALCGEINNAANSSTAIKIATNGDGMAASFSLTKADNANNAVRVTHDGVGSGDSAGIRVTTTNTAHGIDSRTTGTAGRAGKFIVENVANNNDVLYLETAYTGGGTTAGRLIDTNKGAYLTNEGSWVAAGGFLPNYTSADTAVSLSQTKTFTHGLGRLPVMVQAWIRCTGVYGAGSYPADRDEWKPISALFRGSGGEYWGSVVEAITDTQIVVRSGDGSVWHGHRLDDYCNTGLIRVMAW